MRYITTIVLVFIVIAGWWLETRFGSMAALAIVGSVVGAALVIAGLIVGLAHQRTTLQAATTFHADITGVERAGMGIDRERARMERAYNEARLRLDQVDARRIDQIAQQRAQLIAKPAPERHPGWDEWNAWSEDAKPESGAGYQVIE